MLDLRHRVSIILYLIEKYNYKSVMEIGVQKGVLPTRMFEHEKWLDVKYDGVDPIGSKYVNHFRTSDSFFALLDNSTKTKWKSAKWDLIFIDGLHTMEQCDVDLVNSLKRLKDGGTIVMHDCNPPTEYLQRPLSEDKGYKWNGTVWKSYVKLRMERTDLSMLVIDTDSGVGIIRKGKQQINEVVLAKNALEYEYFAENRKEMLNLMSVAEFLKLENGEKNEIK